MRDLFFAVLFAVAVPYCLVHAEYAISLWYWASLFQPQTQTWSFGRSIPYGLISALTAVSAWAFFKGSRLPPATPIVVILILLGAWTGVTTLNSVFFTTALNEWDLFIRLLVMVLLGIVLTKTRRHLEILLWTICASIGFYGFKIGLFSLKGGLGTEIHGPTFMNGNNEVARGMIMFIPFLFYLYKYYPRLWVRAGVVTTGLLSTTTLIMSGSRGAWLGAIAMVLYIALRTRRGLISVLVCGVVLYASLPFIPQRILDRFGTIQHYETDNSVQGRLDAWRYALAKFPERPIMGGGFKVFELEHKKASHDSYFQMLGEHGAVGLLLYLASLTIAVLTAASIRRKTSKHEQLKWASDLSFCCQVALVGYMVGSISINHAFFPIYYAILGLLASTQIIVRSELSQPDSVANAEAIELRRGWRAA